MEIVKGFLIMVTCILFIFGISLPQSKLSPKCDTCEVSKLTKADSVLIAQELQHKVDSFVAVKKYELTKIKDSLKKIEKKLK